MKDKDEMFDDFRFDDDDDLDFDINDDDSLDKPIFDVHFDVDDTPYPPVTLNPGKRIVGGMTLERAEFTDRLSVNSSLMNSLSIMSLSETVLLTESTVRAESS